MSHPTHILEYTRVSQARQIDEEKGVLHDLAVLGPESANGRDWPEPTMRNMLGLLEGRQAFADHNKAGEPSVYHVLGVWRNCRVDEGKTRGDFHFFKSHPLAARLVEAARRPELNNALGFSINARGRTNTRDGRQVVESVEEVISIDCVAQPATLNGLYESRSHPMTSTAGRLAELLARTRPKYGRALKEAIESGVMSPDAPMDAPPDAPAADGDHEAAILDAAAAVLRDDALSVADKLKKIKTLLKMTEGGGGGATDDTPTEESRRLKAENGQLLAEKLVRKAAGEASLSLKESLVERLARPGMTEQQAKEAVSELAELGRGGQRPRSAAPVVPAGGKDVRESKAGEPEIPADPKARAAWLRRG